MSVVLRRKDATGIKNKLRWNLQTCYKLSEQLISDLNGKTEQARYRTRRVFVFVAAVWLGLTICSA